MKRPKMLDRLARGENPIDIAIIKAEEMVLGKRVYSHTCALCEVYKDCYECPVKRKTGLQGCKGTPFWDWFDARTVESAIKWLEFLKEIKREEEWNAN